MSLFGYFVIARSDRPLVDLPSVRRVCTESSDDIGPGSAAGTLVDGEWQFLQVLGGFGLEASEVAAETAGPALVIYVIESAIGFMTGALPDGTDWSGSLNPSDVIEKFDTPEYLVDTVEETTGRAAGWARAAGRTPDEDAVAAAIDQYVGPFGESVDAFVKALGFHFVERVDE